MKKVDYAKLSEQYGGFLVAAGGVSITALAVLLSLTRNSGPSPQQTLEVSVAHEKVETARLFLVAALIVGTVSCFAGAHMMAETAAFFTQLTRKRWHFKAALGQRLFVLATAHVFMAIGLILFAVVLLPTVTADARLVDGMKLISPWVLIAVLLGALVWMVFATFERTPTIGTDLYVIAIGLAIGLGMGLVMGTGRIWPYWSFETLASRMFIIIVSVTAISLGYFAVIFKFGIVPARRLGRNIEVAAFTSAITFTYTSLVVAYFKILY